MKNIFTFLLAGAMLFTTLGCGLVSGLEDEAVNVAVGDMKVGIKECDDVIEKLAESVNNPDDGIVVKGAKRLALNQFREEVRRRLDESQTDRQAVAEFCREFGKNLATGNSNANTRR